MSRPVLRLGFVPLTDCAPLVVANEMGFAAEEGVDLHLTAAPSWARLRDRLLMGELDAAHMLAPVPVALAMGLGPEGASLEALQVLSVNGTVVGVSRELAGRLAAQYGAIPFGDAMAYREAVLGVGPLRVAVPFGFSMHRELLHRWLGAEADLAVSTVPPSRMAEALAAGAVDLFCVGEPWGSDAVEAGVAELILPGCAIWQFAPEKVLAARTGWAEAHPDEAGALMRAVWRAGQWLSKAEHRATAVELLSRDDYLARAPDLLDRAMTGHLTTTPEGAVRNVPGFLRFHDGAASFPWRSQAAWIATQLALRSHLSVTESVAAAKEVFRSDLYRQHLSPLRAPMPGASLRVEGGVGEVLVMGRLRLLPDAFFDGRVFDPEA